MLLVSLFNLDDRLNEHSFIKENDSVVTMKNGMQCIDFKILQLELKSPVSWQLKDTGGGVLFIEEK